MAEANLPPPADTKKKTDKPSPSFWDRVAHNLVGAIKDMPEAAKSDATAFVNALNNASEKIDVIGRVEGKYNTPKAAPQTPAPVSNAGSSAEQNLIDQQQTEAANIWNEAGQALANESSAIEGQWKQDLANTGTAQAASTGLAPTGAASQWLSSNLKTSDASSNPLIAAMNEYAKVSGNGVSQIDTVMKEMGQANAQLLETAPYADWMQALVQHVMSNVNYNDSISPQQAAILPDWLKFGLSQSGAGGGTTGAESLQSLSAGLNANLEPKGTQSTSGLAGIANSAGTTPSSSTGGNIPSTSTAAGT